MSHTTLQTSLLNRLTMYLLTVAQTTNLLLVGVLFAFSFLVGVAIKYAIINLRNPVVVWPHATKIVVALVMEVVALYLVCTLWQC